MALIEKNTQMRIEGSWDGMIRISTSAGDFLVDEFRYPFYKLVTTDQEGDVTADDWICDDVETLQDWADGKNWKGVSPCLSAESSFKEGYAPWFLAPDDLDVWTQEELDTGSSDD